MLLCYNLSDERFAAIRLAAMRLKIRLRPVEKAEYARTIGSLCGLTPEEETVYEGEGFQDEMLVMAHFPAGMMNAFLQSFRRLKIKPVALKAMLTLTNSQWSSAHLHEEISSEHEAMMNGGQSIHSQKQ